MHGVINHLFSFVSIRMQTTVYAVILIFVLKEATSFTRITKFDRFSALDEQKCPSEHILFEIETILSITECLAKCSSVSACSAIAYRPVTKECIGCDYQFNSSVQTDKFENSIFYKRNGCPNSNGIAQPEASFRMKIYTEGRNQTDAIAVCEKDLGGHLVTLDEQWKIEAVSTILMTCSGYTGIDHYWVDGKLADNQIDWKFGDGSPMPMTQKTFWMVNEPDLDGPGFSLCVSLKSREQDRVNRFDDKPCDRVYPFICQF